MKCTTLSKLLLLLLIMPPLLSLFLSMLGCKEGKHTNIPVATADLKKPVKQSIFLQDISSVLFWWMRQSTKAVIPKRGNTVKRNLVLQYFLTSVKRLIMTTPEHITPRLQPWKSVLLQNGLCISAYIVIFSRRQVTPLICSKLQFQAKTSLEEKCFWPSIFIYEQDTISFYCRKSPAHSVTISSKVN